MRAVVNPGPVRLDEFAGRDHRCVADESDEIALASRFDPQYAETVLGIVERYTVDQARQDLRRAHRRCQHHPRMMDAEMRGFQNSFIPSPSKLSHAQEAEIRRATVLSVEGRQTL